MKNKKDVTVLAVVKSITDYNFSLVSLI